MSHTLVRPGGQRRTALLARALVIAVVAAVLVGLPTQSARAATDFYSTPATLPAHNGDLVRQESSSFYLDPLKALKAPANVTRIMYRTTDRNDTPIAVTGTVLVPKTAWIGLGQRPLVAYAVGTQGLGDSCAPSRQLAAGSEYEGLFIQGLLARGYAVVVTDYQGLGTEGLHTYMSRVVQGRAVLDSLRAAQRAGVGIPAAGPVAITGYSQGGGSAASAAEQAASYAPELKLKGTVAGAVPADLGIVAKQLDGSLYWGFLGYALDGLAASYGLDKTPYLNANGVATLKALETECTIETIAKHPFVSTGSLTATGQSATAMLQQEPFKSIVGAQLIGTLKPNAPVLVTHSLLDDVIPYAAGKQLAKRWCGKGANIRLETGVAPTHVGGAVESYPKSFAFLEARFAGIPQISNCWAL